MMCVMWRLTFDHGGDSMQNGSEPNYAAIRCCRILPCSGHDLVVWIGGVTFPSLFLIHVSKRVCSFEQFSFRRLICIYMPLTWFALIIVILLYSCTGLVWIRER